MTDRRPILLFDVMDTLVREPFFTDVPAFFGMTLDELFAEKHPTSWIDFEHGRIDEARYFESCRIPRDNVFEFAGQRIGVTICEDAWNDKDYWDKRTYDRDPLEDAADFGPDVLVVALGLDASEHDPLAFLAVTTDGFRRIGSGLGRVRMPTLLVQEGGYVSDHLGPNLRAVLQGFEQAR